jgi:hypothetical protein
MSGGLAAGRQRTGASCWRRESITEPGAQDDIGRTHHTRPRRRYNVSGGHRWNWVASGDRLDNHRSTFFFNICQRVVRLEGADIPFVRQSMVGHRYPGVTSVGPTGDGWCRVFPSVTSASAAIFSYLGRRTTDDPSPPVTGPDARQYGGSSSRSRQVFLAGFVISRKVSPRIVRDCLLRSCLKPLASSAALKVRW